MTQPPPRPRTVTALSRARRWVGAALVAAAVLPLLGPAVASGDPVHDKLVEARQVADRLDLLQRQESVLAEQFDQARLAVAQVDAQVLVNRQRLDQAHRLLTKRTKELARYAALAYMRGGDDVLSLVLQGGVGNAGASEGYLSATSSEKERLIAEVAAARTANATAADRLAHARDAAARASDDLESRRQAVTSLVTEQQLIVTQVQGELKLVVAQEEARRVAEAQLRALAAARAISAAAPGLPAGWLPPIPLPGTAGADVIKWAASRLGAPYVWGGAGPNVFDCSGLVMWSWANAGRGNLPHSAAAMYAMSLHLPLDALQPGDLVFFGNPVHHVGIYVGGGVMLDALNSATPVKYHSIYALGEVPLGGRL